MSGSAMLRLARKGIHPLPDRTSSIRDPIPAKKTSEPDIDDTSGGVIPVHFVSEIFRKPLHFVQCDRTLLQCGSVCYLLPSFSDSSLDWGRLFIQAALFLCPFFLRHSGAGAGISISEDRASAACECSRRNECRAPKVGLCRSSPTRWLASRIGPVNLAAKRTGELSGKSAPCVRRGGTGNVARSRCCDTRRRTIEAAGNTNIDLNRRTSLRPY